MATLVLKRSDVSRHTDALALLHELRAALSGGARPAAGEPGAASHPSVPARSLTLHRGGLSLLQLFDAQTGALLALMEIEALAGLRAALVAALAVEALCAQEAKRIAVLGSGTHASTALKTLRLVRSLREVRLVGPSFEQAVIEAAQLQQVLKTPVHAVEQPIDALEKADVVVLTGGVSLPEVALWPSVLLSLPSAARFSTAPLSPGLLARAFRVSDGPGEHWGQPVQAQLGPVLAGTALPPPGVNPVFLGGDPPWLDLLAAWHVYLGAQADEALLRVDFEA